MRVKLIFSLICFSFILLFVEKTIAETAYPVIHLGTPIEQQVQLFATDRVVIHDGQGALISAESGTPLRF